VVFQVIAESTAGTVDSGLANLSQEKVAQDNLGVSKITKAYIDKLTVLAGGGVRAHNVRDVVMRSGVREVHANGIDPMIVRDVMLALSGA